MSGTCITNVNHEKYVNQANNDILIYIQYNNKLYI